MHLTYTKLSGIQDCVDDWAPIYIGTQTNEVLPEHAGFADPFDHNTVTLDNPAYRYLGFSLMKGKLDWLLLRKMQVLEKSIGNHSYSASDHKWLSATVTFKQLVQ